MHSAPASLAHRAGAGADTDVNRHVSAFRVIRLVLYLEVGRRFIG